MGSRPTLCINCSRPIRRQLHTISSFSPRDKSSTGSKALGQERSRHLVNQGYGFKLPIANRTTPSRTFHSGVARGHRQELGCTSNNEHTQDAATHIESGQHVPPDRSWTDSRLDAWLKKYRVDKDAFVQLQARPQASSYPSLPPELFDPSSGSAIHKAFKEILPDDVQWAFRTREQSSKEPRFRSMQILLDGKSKRIAALGEGSTKDAAIKAAYLDLVAKLDHAGLLNSFWLRKKDAGVRKKEAETLDFLGSERFSKLQVFNYASRFGCFPNVKVERVESQTGSLLFRTTISLHELGVVGIGEAQDVALSEIYAALHCKSQLELLRSRESSKRLDLRDYKALSLDNASDFIRFFLRNHPDSRITFDESVTDPYGLGFEYSRVQICLDNQPLGPPALMLERSQAVRTAFLFAAVELTNQHSELFAEYHEDLREGRGLTSRRLEPVSFQIDGPMRAYMEDVISQAEKPAQGVRISSSLENLYEKFAHGKLGYAARLGTVEKLLDRDPSPQTPEASENANLGSDDPEFTHSNLQDWLPMREYSEELLDIVSNNPFCIISGTTGSGKSTQVPQILLEEALRHGPDQTCNIICTEPRRVAVTTLAERVAAERAEGVGDSVGYRVSFDRVLPRMPQRVTYCTPEILSLQMLHSNEDVLANLTHIIVDEVHERNARTDGLLSQLKLAYDNRVRAGKPFPKVILMSASLDGGLIEEYFSLRTADGKVKRCPVLTVPGKVHEVEYKDLEDVDKELSSDTVLRTARTLLRDSDYEKFMKLEKAVKPLASSPSNMLIGWRSEWEIAQDREEARVSYALVAATIAKICKSDEKGAILAFLPGWNEIKRVEELLQRGKVFGLDFKNTSKFRISLLHSTNPAGMEEALTPLPDTCRKILLATNIAETSITIPDVRFVVDSAKQRTPRYDHVRKLSVLDREWVSRSSIVQRAGRAGRTQPGTYYGLLSKNRHELLRDTIAQPSIDSSHLHLACLRARSQFPEMSLPEYFAQLLEAPSRDEVAAAVKDLQNIGAIGPDLTVTLFGRLLGEFPTQPSITRMILLGVMFRCLQPMIVLGGFLTTNQQFFMHPETTKDKLRADAIRAIYSQGTASDHIASISAFDELQSIETREGPDAAVEWAEKSFLNIHAFKIVQKYMLQIQRVMWDRRIVRDIYSAEHNVNSTELSLIKALFLSGVAPNVGLRRTSNQFWTRSGTEALLPMDSAARPTHWMSGKDADRTLCCYSHLNVVKEGHLAMFRDVSMVTPLMTALFGGQITPHPDVEANSFRIDKWLPIKVNGHEEKSEALQVFMTFREIWDQLSHNLLEELSLPELTERWKRKDPLLLTSFVNAIIHLLNYESGLLETRRGISTQPATADGPEQMDEKESVTGH